MESTPLSTNPVSRGSDPEPVLLKEAPPSILTIDPLNPSLPSVKVQNCVGQDEFDRVFDECDTDRSGLVDLNEFKTWTKGKFGITEEAAIAAFNIGDKDNSKTIDKKELKAVVDKLNDLKRTFDQDNEDKLAKEVVCLLACQAYQYGK